MGRRREKYLKIYGYRLMMSEENILLPMIIPLEKIEDVSEREYYIVQLGDTFASDSNMVAEYRAEHIRRYYFYCL